MTFFSTMLSLLLTVFTLILTGILLRIIGLVSDTGRKVLSDLLIYAILPCNIVQSFCGDTQISREFMMNCIAAVLISALIQISAMYGSKLLFYRYPPVRKSVLSYATICSNSSFVGLPIADTLFGDLGTMYTSVFQIPIRLTMWTAGLGLFTTVNRRDAFRKLVCHPCIVAILIGLALMVLPISLPVFLNNTIQSISHCTTSLSMFIIGSILADAPIRSLFSIHVLYYTFIRLLAIPLLVFLVLRPLHLDAILVNIVLLMTGMPAGSSTSILADKYGGDAPFAAQLIFTSTLFSMITIPLLTLLM